RRVMLSGMLTPHEAVGAGRPVDARPSLSGLLAGALLWAAAGAGLFLGVGAALPVWQVRPMTRVFRPDGSYDYVGPTSGPMWEAASAMRWPPSVGHDVVTYGLLLFFGGANAGLYAGLAWRWLRRRKGGGAGSPVREQVGNVGSFGACRQF